ncbi:hypothetical protein BH24ACT1_BH24ACT1_08260 [soil metagenome]
MTHTILMTVHIVAGAGRLARRYPTSGPKMAAELAVSWGQNVRGCIERRSRYPTAGMTPSRPAW